jgi:hypothetical protein
VSYEKLYRREKSKRMFLQTLVNLILIVATLIGTKILQVNTSNPPPNIPANTYNLTPDPPVHPSNLPPYPTGISLSLIEPIIFLALKELIDNLSKVISIIKNLHDIKNLRKPDDLNKPLNDQEREFILNERSVESAPFSQENIKKENLDHELILAWDTRIRHNIELLTRYVSEKNLPLNQLVQIIKPIEDELCQTIEYCLSKFSSKMDQWEAYYNKYCITKSVS